MKWSSSTSVSRVLNGVGRLVLTAAVALGFLFFLKTVLRAHAMLLGSPLQAARPIYVGKPAASRPRGPVVHPFWPEFPRGDAGNLQSAVINGVRIMTEQWEAAASVPDILRFYREQMSARGWQDVTEDTYGLQQPAEIEALSGPQTERFVENYQNVMDSTLVLSRGEWTMHVRAELGEKNPPKTAVRIYAFATSSLDNLFNAAGSAVPGNRAKARSLDAVQQDGKDRYHTTVTSRNSSPAQAFREELADLGTHGWRPVMLLPRPQTRHDLFAWLARDKEYGALAVSASPQGVAITFTQVTPDSQ